MIAIGFREQNDKKDHGLEICGWQCTVSHESSSFVPLLQLLVQSYRDK